MYHYYYYYLSHVWPTGVFHSLKVFIKKIYYYYIYNKGAFVNDLSQVRLLVRIYTKTDYQTSYSSFPKLFPDG